MNHKRFNVVFSLLIILALLLGAVAPAIAQVPTQSQGTSQGNGNGKGHGNGKMRSTTPAERKAARLQQAPPKKGVSKTFAGVNPATAQLSTLTTGAPALAAMAAPLSPPDYFGVPNWANSPLPTVATVGTTTPVTVGNALISRAYATDFATPPGTLGPAFVVVPNAVMPSGTLQSFQIWNQASPGGSPTPSAGNVFHAYLLQPTGTANQYVVVFDSGLLTVPALPTGNTTGQVQTFSVGSVPVLAGDVIGFYGEGIPVDTGVTAKQDILSYPAPTAPSAGITVTLGVDPGFPIYAVQDRTYSIAANVSVVNTTTTFSGGMRKFVDTLPGLSFASSSPVAGNDLGQYIPVAFADTTSFTGTTTNPAADYYEIGLVQYREQMHADLPITGTLLRGYVQLETPANASVSKHIALTNANLDGTTTPILRNGLPVFAVDKPSYLGPVVIAAKNRPVRVKFTNFLPTGAGGDLFIPTDTTYMGAGMGPDGTPYSENRATLHLHGGNTPWISDGTPHQWTVPAAETSTNFKKGLSVGYVPDMWFDASGNGIPSCSQQTTCAVVGATNNPGAGSLTFYWTNQQGGRLMFYHDHAYGITRLNVYVGEAAGYLLSDPTTEDQLATATVPGTVGTTPDLAHLLPLVIQDKSFVPDNGVAGGQLAATDPTWDTVKFGGTGNLWFPHVYMPNQNPADITGANAFGRWDYGPWFWPPQNPATLVSQPFPCQSSAYTVASPPAFPPLLCPGTPNPSGVPEGFMDTPLVNGTAYPALTVDPAAYRFQVLSASNDRTLNLGLYVADPLAIAVTNGGSGYTTPPTVGLVGGGGSGAVLTSKISTGSVTGILVTGVGSGYTSSVPNVTITGDGTGATAVAVIDPLVGQVTAVNVTNIGSGYTFANVAIDPPSGCATGCVTATATATLTPAGAVLGVTVVNPGSGWTSNPAVTFTGGGGTGATAIASINTEVKMLPAVPPAAGTALPMCSTATATSGAQLALATIVSGNPLNNTGLPPNCWPTTWPTDGRDGGVPDPTTAGPPIIQIGTEGGLLPSPSVIPSTPTGYEYNRRSITVLNVFTHGLLVGPAERADVVVDFSKFAGKTLILYNDAAAPVPAFDPRNDYYTGDPDQTLTGGAPSTLPGYGPNTRTIMQIKVNATATNPNLVPFSLSSVTTAMPNIFATTQDKIIVPEPTYPAANGGGQPTYARIQDNAINAWIGGPVGGLTLTSGGVGYTSTPTVSLTGGGGSGAAATATLSPAAVASVSLSNTGGFGYTSAPAVSFSGGGGTGAATTAVLGNGGVRSITVNAGGSGYTTAPTVLISAPNAPGCPTGCVQATATATQRTSGQRNITSVTVTNPGSGYITAPTITFSGGGGTGATATALLGQRVVSFTITNVGSGYTSAPAVSVAAPPAANCNPAANCTGATAAAVLATRVVANVTLTNGGTGYTGAPTVSFVGGGGSGATAVATAPSTPFQPKAIQELFTLDYGRMNATLGVEIPKTNFQTQTTIPYGYVDPPTEILKDGEIQIWKITHNGVDTHFIHFHLFNVQVINRVGWDGAIKPPDANELAWKDTVRMNPLEDIIVALKPMKQNLPWDLPNSVRPLDVTQPVGGAAGFTNVDPTGQPAVVTNLLTNFGYEYVWHCHILGHEENDMMRAMILAVPPKAPGTPVATGSRQGNTARVALNWIDNSLNETGWTVQRAASANGPWTTVATVASATGPSTGTIVSYTDTTVARTTTYFYRVIANNVVGYTQTYAAPAAGYPNTSADSAPTAPSSVTTP